MTEQVQRDRLADTEKWLERWATITVELAMMKVAAKEAVSKGALGDRLKEHMDEVRKDRERAMTELKNEMHNAFADAIDAAFKKHSEDQQKTIRLYTRIGMALLVVLVAKDAGSFITLIRTFLGFA